MGLTIFLICLGLFILVIILGNQPSTGSNSNGNKNSNVESPQTNNNLSNNSVARNVTSSSSSNQTNVSHSGQCIFSQNGWRVYEGTDWFCMIVANGNTYYMFKTHSRICLLNNNDVMGLLKNSAYWCYWKTKDTDSLSTSDSDYKCVNMDINGKISYSNEPHTFFDETVDHSPFNIDCFRRYAKEKGFLTFEHEDIKRVNNWFLGENRSIQRQRTTSLCRYLYVRVKFPNSDRLYWYISDNPSVQVGDNVRIINQYGINNANIVRKLYCTEEDAPYPPSQTKHI